MKITKIALILCFVMASIPGCAKKQAQNKTPAPEVLDAKAQKEKELKTSLDLLGDIKKETLTEKGLTSSVQKKEPPVKETYELLGQKQPSTGTESLTHADESIEAYKGAKPESTHIPTFLEGDDTLEFNFENVDLEQLVAQISAFFNVTFVSEDMINPIPQGARPIKGNKISFKTQQPLNKKDAWNLFVTFLDIAGFAIVSEGTPRLFRIATIETARKSPLKSFIGVSSEILPDSDQLIRYVYFIENTSVDTIKGVVDSLRSSTSSLTVLQDLKAFIITDKSYNIKSLMNIIRELDKVTMPQSMSVLKLKRADANDVKKLYDTIIGADEKTATANRLFPQLRKQPSSAYFPENTRIIPEPRTNSLILLGPADAIARIENFIKQNIDTTLDQQYSPLFIVPLKNADATTVANIMNEVTQFGKNTDAGRVGGVRGDDKYMKPITFTPEPENNRIVVKGNYDDYMRAKEIITQLDTSQPQVAIEVLILSFTAENVRQLGAALRSREPGTGTQFLGSAAKFQTSGFYGGTSNTPQGIIQNPDGAGVMRLLGNLLNLVNFAVPGNTVLSLGDSLSTWAILQALDQITTTQLLANPFLVASNKTKAQVLLGETRRVQTGTIVGGAGTSTAIYGDASANLEVHVTPQINNDGLIIMDLKVKLEDFTSEQSSATPTRTVREIDTKTIVADKEVLALGGLIRNRVTNNQTKLPILADIPIVGWLFKNKQRTDNKENLLILISSRIIQADTQEVAQAYTSDHVQVYKSTLDYMKDGATNEKDLVDRWFFKGVEDKSGRRSAENFIFRHEQDKTVTTGASADITVKNSQEQKPVQVASDKQKRPSLLDLVDQKSRGATT